MNDDKAHLRRKADELLQEFRIVLPGTQALLGFQLIAFFNSDFHDLPPADVYLHFMAFILTVISTLALFAPVAFQQLGEGGHTTQRFLRFSRTMLNGAMFLLLVAISLEIHVVCQAIDLSQSVSILLSGLIFLAGVCFWYAASFVRRKV